VTASTHPSATPSLAFDRSLRRTWIVTDAPNVLAALDLTNDIALDAPASPAESVRQGWANSVTAWMNIELGAVQRDTMPPPRAARALALLAVGLNDGLLVADEARRNGMSVSDAALLAQIASTIGPYLHPALADRFTTAATTAQWMDVWDAHVTPESVRTGQAIGRAVAADVLAFAAADGSDAPPTYGNLEPADPGMWRPTPPELALPLLPQWGQVKPIVPASSQALAAAPPAWDDAAFASDRAAFVQAQRALSPADRNLAKLWAGGSGTVTPAGLWIEQARTRIVRDRLDNVAAAAVYSAVAVATHDGFIACWASKYRYMVARPISWMQPDSAASPLPGWEPVIKTPPFPSYPSGHAVISAAAAAVLTAFFPNDAAALQASATDAAQSRVVGGIHWGIDSRGGLDEGAHVGALVLEHLTAAPPAAHVR
jgi:membrane-associated phospholipid phosphatase